MTGKVLARLKAELFFSMLTKIRNSSIEKRTFPDKFKLSGVRPAARKGDDLNKGNYRQVSVLAPHISVICERIIFH